MANNINVVNVDMNIIYFIRLILKEEIKFIIESMQKSIRQNSLLTIARTRVNKGAEAMLDMQRK